MNEQNENLRDDFESSLEDVKRLLAEAEPELPPETEEASAPVPDDAQAVPAPEIPAQAVPAFEDFDPEDGLPPEEPPKKRARKEIPEQYALPKWLKAMLYAVGVLAVSFAVSVGVWFCAEDVFAFGKPDQEVSVTIRNGDTLNDVIDTLADRELIRYKWLFKLFCGVTNAEEKISAGTYTVNRMYDYHAIVNSMTAYSAARAVVDLTVPEGYTCGRVFDLLEDNGVCTREELENAASSVKFDYAFLEGIPYGSPNRLEGYLFPDTYQFYVGDDPERVLKKFLSNFEVKLTDALLEDLNGLNTALAGKMRAGGFTESEIEAARIDLRRLVIVASIVQTESFSVSESADVAAVIYNRLSSKTYPLLQIDSVLRYGLNKWDGELTDADYRADSGYNTSRNSGLPEGPISNPGIESFRAALYPRDSACQFYCYDPSTGLHFFADSYYEYQDFLGGKAK